LAQTTLAQLWLRTLHRAGEVNLVRKFLNSKEYKKEHPEAGEDIKIMALRRGKKVDLTVAMAIVTAS